jgi:hypothetical protein
MHLHIWKPSSPGRTSDRLDPSGPDLWWQKLPRFIVPVPTKEFQAAQHSITLRAQLINKKFTQTIKHAYNSNRLQDGTDQAWHNS